MSARQLFSLQMAAVYEIDCRLARFSRSSTSWPHKWVIAQYLELWKIATRLLITAEDCGVNRVSRIVT